MVTRGYYSEEETTFRRCGPRGQSYSLAQERSEHPHVSRSYSDGRSGDHGPESIEPGHQMRRRIQVACQRCRKRKIRCSGENDGRPCYHCKQSSTDPCVFLRVTAMQLEQAKDFPPEYYDDNSRSMYRATPNAQFNNYYAQSSQNINLSPDGLNYRPTNYSNYGYQGTRFLGLAYDNFTEEPGEFNLSNPNAFQLAAQDPVSVSSYPAQNRRAQMNPPAPMYMDSEATANYNQTYPGYNARSAVDSESKNFCVTNTTYNPTCSTPSAATVSQTALAATNGSERLLPYPSVNRQYRSTNDGISSSQGSFPNYAFLNSNIGIGTGKINGTSAQMPLTNSYMNVPTSSSHEITTAAAEMAYNSSQQLSIAQQDTEMYDAATPNSSLYYSNSQTNDSTADISHYGTSSGSDTPKSRQTSQTTTENSWAASNRKSSSSGSSGTGLLANGQVYHPNTQDHYPLPNLPAGVQSPGFSQQLPQISQVHHDGLPSSRDISNG